MHVPITVRFDVREDDVIAVNKYALRGSGLVKMVRRRGLRNLAVAWVVVVGALAGFSYWKAADSAAGLKAAVLCVVAYAIIGPVYAWWSFSPRAVQKRLDRVVERAVRTGKIHVTRGPAEVRLEDDHIAMIETDGTMAKPWSALKSVETAEEGVYFAFSDGVHFGVPARAFASGQDMERFAAAARDRANPGGDFA